MLKIRNLRPEEIGEASQLLTAAFIVDGGMTSLYPPMNDAALARAVKGWFEVTLHTWLANKQIVLAAYNDQQLVGVLVAGHTLFKMNVFTQLKWAWGVWHLDVAL